MIKQEGEHGYSTCPLHTMTPAAGDVGPWMDPDAGAGVSAVMREGPARSRYSNTGDVALVHLQFPVGSFSIVWLARYSIRVHLLHRTACTASI